MTLPGSTTEGQQRLARRVVQAQVDQPVIQKPPDQEFHRQVIDPLGAGGIAAPGRGKPDIDDPVAQRVAQRHAPVVGGGVVGILAGGVIQVVQDGRLHILRAIPGRIVHMNVPRTGIELL
jgi:hypothetical protein